MILSVLCENYKYGNLHRGKGGVYMSGLSPTDGFIGNKVKEKKE